MISRQWTGIAHHERAEEYIEHLQQSTFPALQNLPGFKGATILRKQHIDGVEFCVITEWESFNVIRAFAGKDITNAVVPPEAQKLMVQYDRRVRHYEVVHRIFEEQL